ncbi:MAG: spheroidene monooxygenase, partial [Ferruginibacter sp.]
MMTTLLIIRYPVKFIPFGFIAMGLFRIPLAMNKNISFFKLLGCGKNGTFDKQPDTRQWAILTVHKNNIQSENFLSPFISHWIKTFNCEKYTLWLNPLEGHGQWDGKFPFGMLPAKSDFKGPLAVLTRATIRLGKLSYFWKHVAPVAAIMKSAAGLLMSVGIGEMPWIKQATFSVWENKESMKSFAY